jgi:hypothetical protein
MLFVQKKERFFWTWGSWSCQWYQHQSYTANIVRIWSISPGGEQERDAANTLHWLLPLYDAIHYAKNTHTHVISFTSWSASWLGTWFRCAVSLSLSLSQACPKEKIQARRVHPVSCVSTQEPDDGPGTNAHYWSELVNCHASIEIVNRIYELRPLLNAEVSCRLLWVTGQTALSFLYVCIYTNNADLGANSELMLVTIR